MKECFDILKKEVPSLEDKKTSNLNILRSALKHIQVGMIFFLLSDQGCTVKALSSKMCRRHVVLVNLNLKSYCIEYEQVWAQQTTK